MSGYIRLHRTLLEEHPAFRNDAQALAFAWMIAKASWAPICLRYKGCKIELQRGQLAVSVRDLATRLDRSKGWVETLLKRLQDESMVRTDARQGVLVVSICNYNKYQALKDSDRTEDRTEGGQQQDSDRTQNKEGKESKEVNESKNSPLRDSSLGATPAADPINYFEIVSSFNWAANLAGLPPCKWPLSDSRKALVRARVKAHGYETVLSELRKIPNQRKFLGSSKGQWRADFGKLMRSDTFIGLMEGRYDHAKQGTRSGSGWDFVPIDGETAQ